MKYLTDPNYVTQFAYGLVPDTLAMMTGFQKLRDINIITGMNKKAFSRFDGIDLNFTISALFKGDENRPRWKKIEKTKKKWNNICVFHGGHENLAKQF